MLINKPKTTEDVKFISYTGKYPALCCGALTLEIDGEIVEFGHDCSLDSCNNYDAFWLSGGGYTFEDNYTKAFAHQGEWAIDIEKLPPKYREFADEIDEVFNDNVEWGCCGGCI